MALYLRLLSIAVLISLALRFTIRRISAVIPAKASPLRALEAKTVAGSAVGRAGGCH
ncbi:MAG: hypothetical protein HYX72_00815 [Acidobacteria bacterium]|nr:hypothetical protein [Acidobacteriota bacterium]